MKTVKMLTIPVMALVLVLWQAEVSKAAPMGTAWTYQGRLMDANDPADGLYDLEFRLFNGPADGNQTGGTVEANDVDVIDGYFTAELNFGSSVFDGNSVWLQIDVRPGDSNDPNAFVTLSTRQEVTPVPYALQTRGIFVDKAGNVGIGTTSPTGKLHVDGGKAKKALNGRDGESIVLKAQDGADAMFGGIGGIGGNIILQPGEGGRSDGIRMRSGRVGIGTDKPDATLDVRGNIKVDQKIQAYDSGGLELATDEGTTRIFVGDDGKVGIGTTSPDRDLEISGILRVARQENNAHGADFSYIVDEPNTGHDGLIINSSTGGGWSDIHLRTRGTTKLFVESGGNVGIGTTSPSEKLDVEGDARVSGNLQVEGAYVGTFPRPAYNSGWVSIAQNSTITLDHNLGGNVDNYVVDMRFKDLSYGKGINNKGIGCDVFVLSSNMLYYGAHWKELTTSSIKVRRDIDDYTIDQVQIRIWVHK